MQLETASVALLTQISSVGKLKMGVRKVMVTKQMNILEYGINLTRWDIILILCKLGWRLKRTKLVNGELTVLGNSGA